VTGDAMTMMRQMVSIVWLFAVVIKEKRMILTDFM
jgi:hypothetical protein